MPKVAVCLSGCGFLDGAEIHEAVCTMLALDRAGATMVLMAPDKPQMHVIDHTSGNPSDETRNVLTESARIARGDIKDVKTVGDRPRRHHPARWLRRGEEPLDVRHRGRRLRGGPRRRPAHLR